MTPVAVGSTVDETFSTRTMAADSGPGGAGGAADGAVGVVDPPPQAIEVARERVVRKSAVMRVMWFMVSELRVAVLG
jgi:hypothetical protein